MTTILDVEKRSGVSRSTISRYFNGKPVREVNRIKIEKAVKELLYTPNPFASGLKTSKSFTIGCVIPDITDPFFPQIIKTIQKRMLEEGYQTIFNAYGNDVNHEVEQVMELANKRVDGLIVATSSTDGSHIKKCIDNDLPVIMLDRLIEGLDCDSVTVDNYQAVYDAISLAIKIGHKKIGYIKGRGLYTDAVRFQAYRDALHKNRMEIRDDYIVNAELVEHDSTRQFMRLMSLSDPPSLIFCSNIYHGIGALEAVVKYEIKIPDDVSVMVFDRISTFPYLSFLENFHPQFASISQPHEEIGLKAAELLLYRLKTGMDNYFPKNIELKTSFYMTDSILNKPMNTENQWKEVPEFTH